MQHDGRRSDWFVLSTDRSFYDTYDITHLNLLVYFVTNIAFTWSLNSHMLMQIERVNHFVAWIGF